MQNLTQKKDWIKALATQKAKHIKNVKEMP